MEYPLTAIRCFTFFTLECRVTVMSSKGRYFGTAKSENNWKYEYAIYVYEYVCGGVKFSDEVAELEEHHSVLIIAN